MFFIQNLFKRINSNSFFINKTYILYLQDHGENRKLNKMGNHVPQFHKQIFSI